MINALIVDDEVFVRKGLRLTINWNEYGINIIGEASSGQEALEFLKKKPVDLMLIDIIMPGMNGFELMERVNTLYPEIILIVVSSHQDFEYAQKAIRIGAIDYLVKTELEQEKLHENLMRISNKIKEARIIKSNTNLNRKNSPEELIIESRIQEALSAEIWFMDENLSHEVFKLCKELKVVSNIFKRSLEAELREAWEVYILDESFDYQKLKSIVDGDDLKKYITQIYRRISLKYKKVNGYSNEIVCTVLKASNYAAKNIGMISFTQENICEKYFISRSYFSKAFRDIMGISFSAYMKQIRIEKAKRLLAENETKIEDIALYVGFEDEKYFNKIFKETTGMSLWEYQNTANN